MEFTEEKAAEIAAKFNLSPITINVWRLRKAIPNKYSKEIVSEKLSKDPEWQRAYDRFMATIKNPKINRLELCRQAKVPVHKLADAKAGKTTFTKDEFIALKEVLVKLRQRVKKLVELKNEEDYWKEGRKKELQTILSDPLFTARLLIENELYYKRIGARNRGRQSLFENAEADWDLNKLQIFMLETQL